MRLLAEGNAEVSFCSKGQMVKMSCAALESKVQFLEKVQGHDVKMSSSPLFSQ